MNKKYMELIEKYGNTGVASELIKASLTEIKFDKENKTGWIVAIFLGGIVGVDVFVSTGSLNKLMNLMNLISAIQVAILGVIFTVYSILLVFLSDVYVKNISEIIDNNTGEYVLKEQTDYFESVLFLNFFALGSTIVLLLIVLCGDEIYLYTLNFLSRTDIKTIEAIIIFLYIAFVSRIFYELKSCLIVK